MNSCKALKKKTIAFQKAVKIYDNDDETETSINSVSPIIMVLLCQATPEEKEDQMWNRTEYAVTALFCNLWCNVFKIIISRLKCVTIL